MENATIIHCPACQKSLKLKQVVNVGQKLKCPNCNHSFQATEEMLHPSAQPAPAVSKPSVPATQPLTQSNQNLVTAIYVGGGAILLAAIIFAAPSFMGNRNEQASEQKEVIESEPAPTDSNSSGDASSKAKAKGDRSTSSQQNESVETTEANQTRQKNSGKPNGLDTKTSLPATKSGESDDPASVNKEEQSTKIDDDPNRPKDVPKVNNEPAKDDADDGFDPNRPRDVDPVINDADKVRPVGGIDGLTNLVNTAPVRTRFIARPIIIIRQVPVPVPQNPGGGNPGAGNPGAGTPGKSKGGSAKGKGQPVVSVQIQPVNSTVTPLVVDNQSNPGQTAQLGINLSGTPTSPISVKITPPTGIVASQSTLSFPANAAPVQQTVTLTGNGTVNLGATQSRLVFATIAASGTGLSAGGPVQVPLNQVRRNRFVLTNPTTGLAVTFARGDVLGNPSKSIWFVFPNAAPAAVALLGSAPANTAQYYTEKHVEIVVPVPGNPAGRRIRLTNTQLLAETTPGSAVYTQLFANTVGTWQ